MKSSHVAAVVTLTIVRALGPCEAELQAGTPERITHKNTGTRCSQEIFHCKTKNNKEVLLCDKGKTLEYSFGKTGMPPELAISVPRETATTWQWKGIGRWLSYSVTITNGDTKYTVFTGLDRVDEAHEFEAGISVHVGDERVARILCVEPIVHNIEGIELREEE